jgi:hypothetical protein
MTTENSRLPEAVATRVERVRRGVGNSRLVTAGETAGRWITTAVRNSWLYGWLTAEPEPEVIVIDLRETYTVGPFIAALDWAIETAAPWYRQSALNRGVDAAVALGERVAGTRVGKLVIALLEPPEPPAEDEREQKREPDDKQR